MRVTEIAVQTGTSPHTVRYYEAIGLLKASREATNRYRRFGMDAITRLRFVRAAKRLGFALSEIREILVACDSGLPPGPMVREIVHRRLAENFSRIEELQRLQSRLELAQRRWASLADSKPDIDAALQVIDLIASDDT